MPRRLPDPPDAKERARLHRRRGVRARSQTRCRRGNYFYRREVTAADRERLVALGHIRRDEAEDRDAVEAALEGIVAEALGR
jgi:hypothetical protein